MKTQVAQFVPYTDTLKENIEEALGYVPADESKVVASVEQPYSVYVTGSNGKNTIIGWSTLALGYSIARRTDTGNIYVGDATEDGHAANKKYVDAAVNSVIDDFYITSSYGTIVLHMKDGSVLSDYTDPRFVSTITNKKYYGKFAKAVISLVDGNGDLQECGTLLQMVYTDGDLYCSWNGHVMFNDPELDPDAESPVPKNFGIETGYYAADFTVKCSNYSGV